MLKVCLATVFACGAVLLGVTGCGEGAESHGDHTPTSVPVETSAPAPTSAAVQSTIASEAPAPPAPEATSVAPPPAAAPEPQAPPAVQVPPAVQAPQPEPAKPAPTLTAPGFEPRAGY